ncbi:MAG TPA: MFS transporter [Pirellulales bacterium]|nr:MFS transporter [Pirellulales bacterium]
MSDRTGLWPLSTAKKAIVAAGCCGMAYTQLTTSPATVQFARSMGATGLEIGILGALPLGLVCMQLLAAVLVQRLERRKPLWMAVSLVQRTCFLPAALGPWLFPEVSDLVWVWTLVALTAINHGLLQLSTPLWLSWMGDYLPHKGLNRFWGVRHSTQQWTAAAALFANAMFFAGSAANIRAAFAGIIVLGVVLGVSDILMFWRVEEPPLRRAAHLSLWQALAAPFRQRDFRGFIVYSCFWNLAAMVGAPFISMFLLEHVGMDLFHILLLWTISWVGGAALSNQLGQLAERFGQRPVLILCTAFKSLNMLGLLLCPRDPQIAFAILAPIFMIDAFLNAGIAIANNGFMIKNSPRENRTMFIAAGTGFAGIVGGVASIVAGAAIACSDGWSWKTGATEYVNFHVLFAISFVLRLACAGLATRVREPNSAGTRVVAGQLLLATRLRVQSLQMAIGHRSRSVSPSALALSQDADELEEVAAPAPRRAA